MLHAEPNKHYDVYPSWAEYLVKWHELPKLLADPLASGLLDANDLRYVENGTLPNAPEPFEMIDGPAGGGVIITTVERPPGLNWCVLSSFAEVPAPMGVNFEVRDNQAHVAYLEPSRPVYLALGRRRPKVYDNCAITFDHTEAAGDRVYWFVDSELGNKQSVVLGEIPRLAAGFGLTAQRLPEPPSALAAETADWGWKDGHSYVWYVVRGGRDGIGFQYAIIVYIGLHLCKVAGRRFKGLHLTAQLETKTRFRRIWAARRSGFKSLYQEAKEELAVKNPGTPASTEEILALVSEKHIRRDWDAHGLVVKGQMGAASIEELIERYRLAHLQRDFESLRALYVWTAARQPAAAIEESERPVHEIVQRFPLQDVVFEASPPSRLGGGEKMVRYVETNRRGRSLIAVGEGRLILVGSDGTRLDPGYAAKHYHERYHISVSDLVATDAADALATRRQPQFICVPMDDQL